MLLLGLGGYFVMSNKDASPKGGTDSGVVGKKADDKATGGLNSLKGLFTAGIPQQCTFKSEMDGYTSEGTVYVVKGKMRGDFSSVVSGKTMASHMIVDGETSYIWTDGEKKGYKTTFTQEMKDEAQKATEEKDTPKPTGGVDLDQMVDYNCKPWGADGSYFQLPEDVEFLSLEDMMKSVTGQMGAQCSICDQLTGDQKTQCLTSLNCN